MTTPNNVLRDKSLKESASILDEDALRRAFGGEKHAPEIKVLQSGLINADVSYALVSGKVPHTQEEFFAVNISSGAPGDNLANWLGSGVFWTYHEAKSYIHYLQSEGLRF